MTTREPKKYHSINVKGNQVDSVTFVNTLFCFTFLCSVFCADADVTALVRFLKNNNWKSFNVCIV